MNTVAEVIAFLSKQRHDHYVCIVEDKLVIVDKPTEQPKASVLPLLAGLNTNNIPFMLRDMAQEFDDGDNDACIVLIVEVQADGKSKVREFGDEFSLHDNTKVGAMYAGVRYLAKRAAQNREG